jgi:hypothetical protein
MSSNQATLPPRDAQNNIERLKIPDEKLNHSTIPNVASAKWHPIRRQFFLIHSSIE